MERASDKHRREASTNHNSKPIWSPTMLPTQACNLETDLIANEKNIPFDHCFCLSTVVDFLSPKLSNTRN